MVRIRAPFHRRDKSLGAADDVRDHADQSKRSVDESDSGNPPKQRLGMSEGGNAAANGSALRPVDDAISQNSHASSSLWDDSHRRLYEHLNARRAGASANTTADNVDNTQEKATSTTDASNDAPPQQNIYETLLGRIHKSLQQLHDQDQEARQGQSSAQADNSTTTSGTLPLLARSKAPNHPQSPDPSVVSTTTNLTKPLRKNKKKKITKRRYLLPVPVKGTKADRLRECLKYFPKRPSPCSFSHPSSSQSSSPSFESRSVTPETSPEAEVEEDSDDH